MKYSNLLIAQGEMTPSSQKTLKTQSRSSHIPTSFADSPPSSSLIFPRGTNRGTPRGPSRCFYCRWGTADQKIVCSWSLRLGGAGCRVRRLQCKRKIKTGGMQEPEILNIWSISELIKTWITV